MNTNSKRKAAQIAKQHSARRVNKRDRERMEAEAAQAEAARIAAQKKKQAYEKAS